MHLADLTRIPEEDLVKQVWEEIKRITSLSPSGSLDIRHVGAAFAPFWRPRELRLALPANTPGNAFAALGSSLTNLRQIGDNLVHLELSAPLIHDLSWLEGRPRLRETSSTFVGN
jgi:hypothetical protein